MSAGMKIEQAREVLLTFDMLHAKTLASLVGERHPLSLTPRQLTLLMTVRNCGGAGIKELAGILEVSMPSISVMVERLVEVGILTREANPTDRRAVLVRISSATEKIIDPMEQQALKSIVDLLDKLGVRDARKWCSLNTRVREIMKAMPATRMNKTASKKRP